MRILHTSIALAKSKHHAVENILRYKRLIQDRSYGGASGEDLGLIRSKTTFDIASGYSDVRN